VLVRIDLRGFFTSIRPGRVYGVLLSAGLPEPVAHTLTGLVTTVAPLDVRRLVPSADRPALGVAHLPTGAPTSPALANLAAFQLDRRLDGLARAFGATYTRYVDDLLFSGGHDLRAHSRRFVALADRIVRDEGFAVAAAKTVTRTRSGRQFALGAVVNARPTLPRPERDALRAILHNCSVHGWRSQAGDRADFPAWVHGRVAWAAGLDPVFGERLRTMVAQIDWS
jgi:RNA-directed DNA polymerase